MRTSPQAPPIDPLRQAQAGAEHLATQGRQACRRLERAHSFDEMQEAAVDLRVVVEKIERSVATWRGESRAADQQRSTTPHGAATGARPTR